MQCPVCNGRLRAIEKYGVEIDICPECKGIWLDRGELEKILTMESAGGPPVDRQNARATEPEPRDRPMRGGPQYRDREDDDDHHQTRQREAHHEEHGRAYQKRRGSWLGDILGGFGGDD